MRASFAVVAILSACGGGDRSRPPADAGPDDDGGSIEDPPAPEAPAPPAPPRLSPCPAGWHETPDEDDPTIVVCEPWAAGARTDCGPGEAWLPGAEACTPVGAACPAGEFADDLPAADVVFVRPGATGDGTLASPLGTIAEALAVAADGATIALSRGVHAGGVVLDRAVTIQGACAAETTVEAPAAAETDGTIGIWAAAVTLGDLTVTGPRIGVRIDGGDVTITSVVVSGAERMGLRIAGGARVTATRLAVRDTGSQAGRFGFGIQVSEGATLDLAGAAVDACRDAGIFVFDAGSAASLADVVVAGTLVEAGTGDFGYGITATLGGRIEIVRTIVEGSARSGLYLDGSSIDAEDLVVRDSGAGQPGVYAGTSDMTLARVTVDRSAGAGLHAVGDGATIEATDVVVRDAQSGGVYALDGAAVSLARAEVAHARVAGLVAGSTGAAAEAGLRGALDLVDVRVRDTDLDAGAAGFGVECIARGDVDATRVEIESSHSAGILLAWGSTLTGTDLAVRDSLPRVTGRGGYGIELYERSTIDVVRVALEANVAFGVLAFDPETFVRIEALDVSGTLRDFEAEQGTGLCALDGAEITVTTFRIAENALCGVQLARDGAIDLADGVIASNAIGANIQVAGFDVGRLQNGVVFRDNGTSLDSTALPVPDSAGSL